MATKSQELAVKITADAADAVKAIGQVDKAAKPLEDGIDVKVKVDADKAATELGTAAKRARELDEQLERLDAGHVRDVEGPAKFAAAAIREVTEEARKADDAMADVGAGAGTGLADIGRNATTASEGTDKLSRAAGGAQNAFANLAGNAAQDFGSMLGPLGSVGVAIGQITEYTADARLGGESMGSALAGAASMAGPLAALSAATLLATNAIERHKARQAELKAINEDLVQSFLDGTGVVEDWGSALEDAFSSGTASKVQSLTKLLSDRLKPDELNRVAVAFGEIGLSMDDLGPVIAAVDDDFQAFAATQLKQAGLSDKQAASAARLIDKYDHLDSLSGDLAGKAVLGDITDPATVAKIDRVTHGLAELADQGQNIKLQAAATEALNAARAFDEAGVAAAEAGGGLPIEQYERYRVAQNDAARAAEEGAKASAESGTILEQVGRQVEEAATLAADAMDKAKKAQDNWLLHEVDYQAGVDDFTESLMKLTEQTKKQADAGVEGAGSFDGNTKAALDNRDALGDVYENAVAVIQSMKDAGFSVDGARTAQDNMAQSAYDLAVQMGFPIEKAQEIHDKIANIQPSVTSDIIIAEQGYEEVKAKKEDLEQDMESTLFINGVLDRSLLDAVAQLPPGAFGVRSVAPSSTTSSAPASMLAAPAPAAATVVVPVAAAAPVSTSHAVNVNVNMSGSIVADTFELQRVVSRAVRQGVRINGARRYQP